MLGVGGRRQPPAYSVAAQMARLNRLGRAHSHEGVTQGYHYHTDPDTDHGTYAATRTESTSRSNSYQPP